jgi:hypothetical protein
VRGEIRIGEGGLLHRLEAAARLTSLPRQVASAVPGEVRTIARRLRGLVDVRPLAQLLERQAAVERAHPRCRGTHRTSR